MISCIRYHICRSVLINMFEQDDVILYWHIPPKNCDLL